MLWEFLADFVDLRLAFPMVLGLVLVGGILREELLDGLVGYKLGLVG